MQQRLLWCQLQGWDVMWIAVKSPLTVATKVKISFQSKNLSSHIGFYCFVILTAKSEHFKQILDFWETGILPWNPLKFRIKKTCPWENVTNRDHINRVALPKANGNQNKRETAEADSLQGPPLSTGAWGNLWGVYVRKGKEWRKNTIPWGEDLWGNLAAIVFPLVLVLVIYGKRGYRKQKGTCW